jgi:hypothetical protein
MKNVVELGYGIFVWPPNWNYKDVNEAIQNGVTPEEFMEILGKRTYRDITAKAMIDKWRFIK